MTLSGEGLTYRSMELPSGILYPFLEILSPLYGGIMRLRALGYQRGLFKTHRLPVPVISIGNLSVGGTGKTPVVRWLVEELDHKGCRPAILTRGYGGDESPEPQRVPIDRRQQSAARYGDEPCLLASALPRIPVITGTDRVRSGHYAIQECNADVLVLDDGYQHLRVHRDLNICLMGPELLKRSHRVLPAGPLREPRSALSRAGLIWVNVTSEDEMPARDQFAQLPEGASALPMAGAVAEPAGLSVIHSGGGRTPLSLETLYGRKVLLLSGIANPARFRRTVESCGVTVADHLRFRDHFPFSPADVEKALDAARRQNCEYVILTEKDAARLLDLFHLNWKLPETPVLAALDIRLRIFTGMETLMELVDRAIKSPQGSVQS